MPTYLPAGRCANMPMYQAGVETVCGLWAEGHTVMLTLGYG
jgi:hypothetical protein